MRIDPKVVVSPIKSATAETAKDRRASAKLGEDASSVVSLSSAARTVGSDGPGSDIGARLEKIRALLDAGEYPVDLDELASRIVDDDLARGGKVS